MTTTLISTPSRNRFQIDRSVIMVAGPVKRTVICKSEIQRPGIDGNKVVPDILISQELAYQEAQRMKLSVEGMAQKHIQGIKDEQGITDAQLDAVFEQAGRTREEGILELEKVYAAGSLMDMKVNSRIIVSQQDVERYFNEHPEYDEPEYYVQTAFIPQGPQESSEELVKRIKEQCESGKEATLPWHEPIWLKEDDIAESRRFVTSMKPGEISDPISVSHGVQVVRLVSVKEKRLIPLERRFKTISKILRQPQYEKLSREYNNELRKNSCIIMLDA